MTFLAVAGTTAAILFFPHREPSKIGHREGCTYTVDGIGLALKKYVAKNKGNLPKASTWQDDLQPLAESELEAYMKRDHPGEPIPKFEWTCTDTQGETTGFAFNPEVSGANREDFDPWIITVFEIPEVRHNFSTLYTPQETVQSTRFKDPNRQWIKIRANGWSNVRE